MARATSVAPARDGAPPPFAQATLRHDERRLRRRMLRLDAGGEILVDLPETVSLGAGDRLVLEDGRHVGIRAADEALYEIRGRDGQHLAEIAWHLGNRHLPSEIAWEDSAGPCIRIARDHVIGTMLAGLGADVEEISAPFSPVHGAYHHDHDHALLAR